MDDVDLRRHIAQRSYFKEREKYKQSNKWFLQLSEAFCKNLRTTLVSTYEHSRLQLKANDKTMQLTMDFELTCSIPKDEHEDIAQFYFGIHQFTREQTENYDRTMRFFVENVSDENWTSFVRDFCELSKYRNSKVDVAPGYVCLHDLVSFPKMEVIYTDVHCFLAIYTTPELPKFCLLFPVPYKRGRALADTIENVTK